MTNADNTPQKLIAATPYFNSEKHNLALSGLIEAMNNINLVRNLKISDLVNPMPNAYKDENNSYFLEEIHDASDKIYYLISDLLANFGYNIMSQTTYNELLEISLLEPEYGSSPSERLLTFVLSLSYPDFHHPENKKLQLLCQDPQVIYEILSQNRDFNLGNSRIRNDAEFLYHKKKMFDLFIHKKIIAVTEESNAKILA
jgi:hypothetical protein